MSVGLAKKLWNASVCIQQRECDVSLKCPIRDDLDALVVCIQIVTERLARMGLKIVQVFFKLLASDR